MNCENCGAPMTLVEGRDHCRCMFCDAFAFPTDLESSADGIKALGQAADAHCPLCRTQLKAGLIEGCRVSYCDTCRGLLTTNDGFGQIVKRRRAKYAGPPNEPVPLKPESLHRRVTCPACEAQMETHPYYGPGNVVIDSCVRCRLVWADHGEIAAIERASGRKW